MDHSLPLDMTLNDGTVIHIRAIGPDDCCLLSQGFAQLSQDSRFMRFLGAHPTLSNAELDTYTAPSDTDHVAIGAMAGDVPVATARFVVMKDLTRAEIALTVVDAYQAKGVGSALLRTLAAIARERRITTFLALVHAENRPMRDLLRRFGAKRIRKEGTEEELELDLNTLSSP